jgi:polar amino acid transport system substrate-binding protein
MDHRRILRPLLLCILLLLPALAEAETLALATDAEAPRSRPDGSGYVDRIVAEACRRAGLGLRIEVMPAERCLVAAAQGLVDGMYARVAGLAERYPGLIMVPEPTETFEFTAYTLRADLRINGWDDLRPLSVGVVIGWKLAEENTREVRERTRVHNEDALFRLLAQGRVDVAVCGGHDVRVLSRRQGLAGLRALSPPLAVRPMHIYLNKRHASLAPRLAEALRGMRADGSLERILREGREGRP